MNKFTYLYLKAKYFTMPLYNNSIEMEVIGFVATSDHPISELDSIPEHVRDLSVPAVGYYAYQVYAPHGVE